MKNNRICEICTKTFYERPSRIAIGKGRFCSKICFDIYQTGKPQKKKGIIKKCEICKSEFYVRQSMSDRRFCSKRCMQGNVGYKPSEETKQKLKIKSLQAGCRPPSAKGKKFTAEHRRKIGRKGPANWNWKGGITEENKRIRSSFEYKEWRLNVFQRDKFKCVMCGKDNKDGSRTPIEADHIKPFAYFPELRFDINNGRTLCTGCHKKTDTYLNRWNKKYQKVNSCQR